MIRIEHLRKEYDGVTPLKDVSVQIDDGDVISIIGPSGTGKSTFLRCINQLEKPTSGRVWLDGVELTDPACDIKEARKRMGMVFQSFNLFGHRTVIENVMLPPIELLGKSRQEAYDEGMRLLRTVDLAEKAFNYPEELSGGQKQRIAIARTLAMDPSVILLDEPTSALDPTMVGEVQAVIRDLAKTGKTLMIVTHEMAFARAICNRVFFMDEGGIYEDGTPEQVFDNPLREKTRRFVRRLKVLELTITSRDFDFLGIEGELIRYAAKSHFPVRLAYRTQLAFEELCEQIVHMLEDPHIAVVIEYSEATEKATLSIRYGGPELNVLTYGDPLAITVVQGVATSIEYRWDEGADLPNQVFLELSEG